MEDLVESSDRLWPVHLKPKEDELCSSWIARLALAHSLHPVRLILIISEGKAWDSDIDRDPSPELLTTLVKKTGVPMGRVMSTGFRTLDGWIYETAASWRAPWIMPLTRSPIKKRYGLQYCAQCLAEDKTPYFRRHWRLAFNTLCLRHCVQLIDRCGCCGAPVNFRKSIRTGRGLAAKGSLTSCNKCMKDLRIMNADSASSPITSAEINFQSSLMSTIELGGLEVPGVGPVYSHLYFRVLRKLLTLLIGSKGRRLRYWVRTRYDSPSSNMAIGGNNAFFENLDVDARREVMGMARELLSEWPARFIDFCKDNKLTTSRLTTGMTYVPFWYWKALRENLTRPGYIRTEEEVESARRCVDKRYGEIRNQRQQTLPEDIRGASLFLHLITKTRRRRLSKFHIPKRRLSSTGPSNFSGRGLDAMPAAKFMSDALWSEVEVLLPRMDNRGRRQISLRKLIDGIVYVLSTNCTWTAMPPEFGNWKTAYCWYQKLQRASLLEKIMAQCSPVYDVEP